jgi:starch phosphorylase
MESKLDNLADNLINKTKQYLIANMGISLQEAKDEELYRALSHMIKEEIMINYLATEETFAKNDVRKLYYFSMEYLPGRLFSNNVYNIAHMDLIKLTLQKMNRNFRNVIAKENEPGLGNGGLGRLASCLLDSLATLHYPARGYGLRYQYGIFEQVIRDGIQIEAPDCWLINENPWEFRQEMQKVTVKFYGHTTNAVTYHGNTVEILHDYDEIWAMPYDIPIIGYDSRNKFTVLTLRLWSTKDSPRNFKLQRYNAGQIDEAAENILISDVLYPNELNITGKRIRLKQEFLLVSASLQDIIKSYLETHDTFKDFADKIRIQINDTHPALAIAELIRILTKVHDIPWKTAVEMTRSVTSYTNHTILAEALEHWDQGLMRQLLPRQYRIIEQLNHEFCTFVREIFPKQEDLIRNLSILENGKVRMANLSIVGSHKINGVAKIHTDILRNRVFKNFHVLWPDRFINITNGVTQRRWLLHSNPEMANFITKRIGDGWITDFSQINRMAEFASDPESQAEFWDIRKHNKDRFISFIKQYGKLHNMPGKVVGSAPIIKNNYLFDVQIKRLHEYKRQLMNALHIIMMYYDILDNLENHSRVHRAMIFGGKAAGGYEVAKNIIRLIFAIARKINKDPRIQNILNIIYIENYNVSKAEIIIPAADISEQISTAGTEASGTSVMKFAMNGALTIGTQDGANVEICEEIGEKWWPFKFGATAEEIAHLNASGSYHPQKIYQENTKIRRAVDSLKDMTFAQNESEHHAFRDIYYKLMESHYDGRPDRYFVLYDLQNYYDTQLRVDALYKDPNLWAQYAINNMAGMGKFSADVSITNYSNLIWQLLPCPIDEAILERVRHDYHKSYVLV